MKETDRWYEEAQRLFRTDRERLGNSLVEGDLLPLLKRRGIEVESTARRMKGQLDGKVLRDRGHGRERLGVGPRRGQDEAQVERHQTVPVQGLTGCSEIVSWVVMTDSIAVSQEQVDAFAAIYPMNARPVQPLNERMIELKD